MQKVASANTESKATIEKLISESGADALLLQYRQLPELPEDAVGRLHQGTVINTSVYLDMLTKSQ